MRSLEKLHAKLDKDVKLKTSYYKVFEDFVQESIAEEISINETVCDYPTFYVSPRHVVK